MNQSTVKNFSSRMLADKAKRQEIKNKNNKVSHPFQH